MKLLSPLLLCAVSATVIPVPALAYQGQRGYSQQCFTEKYREEYVPGTVDRPGTVRTWVEQVEVACGTGYQQAPAQNPAPAPARVQQRVDDNSCVEGAVLGGLAGGAGGAALSRDEGNFIGIPLGIVAGALIGCQIDGG